MEERLDRYLASETGLTRSEAKKKIKDGRVSVDGSCKVRPETKIRPGICCVYLDGNEIRKTGPVYLMMNKPAGVLSATRDRERTVLDLLPEGAFPRQEDLFPAGRLDKDSEGLLLLTDDGQLAHALLSPRSHVGKTYFVVLDGELPEGIRARFLEGIDIGEEKPAKPADLRAIEKDGTIHPSPCQGPIARAAESLRQEDLQKRGEGKGAALVTITEGKYHQIRRMFQKEGLCVLYLKRLSMGPLCLDRALSPGSFRALTQAEVFSLKERREVTDA